MRTELSRKTTLVIDEGADLEIDFSKISRVVINTHEIKKCLLTGQYGSEHSIKPANIVLSKVDRLLSLNGFWEYVDFKDSFIINSKFESSSFDFGAIINCQFESTIFVNCTFKNVSITEVEFKDVQFINCTLDNMIIESCTFNSCKFEGNSTSNKLFELCGFFDTKFIDTDIQVQTLLGNFGLESACFERLKIRSQSTKFDYKYLSEEEVRAYPVSTTLEAFKIEYFYDTTCITTGDDIFEKTFELDSWVDIAQIPKTFNHLLSLYQEFLSSQYDNGTMSFLPLLKLHSLTGELANSSLDLTLLKGVYGVHMALSKRVEEFLFALSIELEKAENPLVLLVNGPIDKDYYKQQLPFVFDKADLEISKIVKHNSPNELFLSWESVQSILPVIAILMASRFKFEIETINNSHIIEVPNDVPLTISQYKKAESNRAFSLSLGFDDESKLLYGLKLKSLLPGNLLLELGLQISLKKVDSVRKILLKILSSSE